MSFLLGPELIHTYQEEGYLSFEDFLPETKFLRLVDAVEKKCEPLSGSSQERFTQLHHLFFDKENIGHMLTSKEFAKPALQLSQAKKLVYACDTVLDWRHDNYPLLDATAPISTFFSVNYLEVFLLLCLSGEGTHPLLPQKPNQACFIQARLPLSWEATVSPGQHFLVIGYGTERASYQMKPHDPNRYFLKRQGYTPKSLLERRTHPLFLSKL